jgi:hypothetical protein
MQRARPRLWETAANVGADLTEIAFHLGLSLTAFRKFRPQLEARGFPKPHPITKRYSVPAVNEWWRQEFEQGSETAAPSRWDKWRPKQRTLGSIK